MPRVTVVTRTKNRPRLLARAFASVRAQTMPDLELIVVNDGGDLADVKRVRDEVLTDAPFPVRIIDNDRPDGRESAINVGFRAATSDALVLLDDDDTWAPVFLERTTAYLDAHPEAVGVATRAAMIRERVTGERIEEIEREVLASDLHQVTFADMMRANYVTTNSFLIRRDTYEKAGPYDGSLPVLADWKFNLAALELGPIGFIDGEPLAFWHVRPAGRGDTGNSVVVAANDHEHYDAVVRDDLLREYMATGRGIGAFLYLADAFNELREGGASSALAAQVSQLEAAIGRMEGRQIETQLALARIEQLQRAGGPLRRRAADTLRELRPGERATKLANSLKQRIRRARTSATAARSRAHAQPSAADTAPTQAASFASSAPEAIAANTVALPSERTPASAFPAGGRRAIIYLYFDPEGRVDRYVTHKLASLRAHAEHILVVSNGPLTPEGRASLEAVSDDVFERENIGFDVWGYKEGQERIGWDALAEFDEVILMNYTFFGPIHPFADTFARADAAAVDFWGLTEHAAIPEAWYSEGKPVPAHIQSHWIAVRGALLRSPEYRRYWDEMPMIESYDDSIRHHEAAFTSHFAERGFEHAVLWPESDYDTDHPVFDSITRMLDDGLPIVKRRLFFHDPLYLEANAIIGRDVMDRVEEAGYPVDLIWENVVRSAPPRTLVTNTTQLEIMPHTEYPAETGRALDRNALPTIAVLMHLYYPELLDEMLERVGRIPGQPRLVITTTDDERAARIRAGLDRRGVGAAEVRVMPTNRGRDVSAFYLGCADVLRDESIDLIVKIHGKKSIQDGSNAGEWFKRHLLDNLVPSEGYTANLIAKFQRDARLGIVFPPVVSIGYPTLGHGWFTNREPAQALAKKLGIRVPLDADTPLAPLGSMFVARRDALATLVNAGFGWDDFPEEGAYGDGTLAHVLERLVTYAVADAGYRVETVMSPEIAAINHAFIEHRLQALEAHMPGSSTLEDVGRLQNPKFSTVVLTGMRWAAANLPGGQKLVWPAFHHLAGARGRVRARIRRR